MKHPKHCLAFGLSLCLALSAFPLEVGASSLSAQDLMKKYSDYFQLCYAEETESFCLVNTNLELLSFLYTDANGAECTAEAADYCPSAARLNDYCVEELPSGARTYQGCTYTDGFYYAVLADGSAIVAGYDLDRFREAEETVLAIPAALDGHVVKEIAPYAFNDFQFAAPTLSQVIIPDTVEIIRTAAFGNVFSSHAAACSINMPANVKVIASSAFGGDTYLAFGNQIILPESLEYLSSSAFERSEVKTLVAPETLFLADGAYIDNMFVNTPNTLSEKEMITLALKERNLPLNFRPTGDVNEDGKTDISDAILLCRYLAEDTTISISAAGVRSADFDLSGQTDATDVAALLCAIAHSTQA